MYLKSMKVTDYSTGSSYSYGDTSGSWQSIKSEGGKINGNSGDEPQEIQSAPSVTSSVSIPVPWSGTHRETSTFDPPSVWPWVPSTLSTTGAADTSVPSGWTVSSTGKMQPPSAASVSEHPPFCHPFCVGPHTNLSSSLPSSLYPRLLRWIHHPSLAIIKPGW